MFFINLAVIIKLHLDFPWGQRTNCQVLFDYYDLFPRLSNYKKIKVKHFAKKLFWETIKKRMTCRKVDNIKNFGEDNRGYLLNNNWKRDNNTKKDDDVPKRNKK